MNLQTLTPQAAKAVATALFAAPGALLLLAPGLARRAARAFPDNAAAGRILSAMALAWAAALIYGTPLDFIANYRVPIALFLLVAIPLSWFWMPVLLAARSLGALLCLLPAPVLVAVRFAPGDGRLVTVSLMYLAAVAGMVSLFSPYKLRDALFWLAGRAAAPVRLLGALLVAAGAAAALC